MKWYEAYLAVPFKDKGRDLDGWDCYGAMRFVLSQTGISLPAYDDVVDEQLALEAMENRWFQIQRFSLQAFDVVTMHVPTKAGRFPFHVGVMVESAFMLHCEEKIGTVCVPLSDQSVNYRIDKFYRHKQLA